MVLPVILVTFSLLLAIFHLCGIWLENATTTPPWKLHCHLHHHHLSRDHYHHYHLMSRMSLKLKYFWNAYNWVLICILESHHYQWSDRKVITDNLSRRLPHPSLVLDMRHLNREPPLTLQTTPREEDDLVFLNCPLTEMSRLVAGGVQCRSMCQIWSLPRDQTINRWDFNKVITAHRDITAS